jgi:hypothetical protein
MAAWALSRMAEEAPLTALDIARLDLDPAIRNIPDAALSRGEG